MTKRTLRVLPVVFLSMMCLMLIVFGCLTAIRENGRIKVGVMVPQQDTMANALVNTIQDMGELSSLCDFSILSEQEGKKKLEQGEISALIVVPEKILQKIYRNDKASIVMYMPGKPTLESAMIREFAEAGSSLVLTAKAGDYTAYHMYQKYGKAGSMQKVAQDMNGQYIQFVIRQKTLFQSQPVAGKDGISDEERMILAGIVLVLFLLAIPVLQLQKKEPAVLSLQLERKGIRPLFSLMCNTLLTAFILWVSMCAGIFVLITMLEWNIVRGGLVFCLFTGCLLTATVFLLLHISGQDTAGGVLLVFFFSLAQIFLAGGIFPVSVLPEICVGIGNSLPGGLLMRFLHQGMSGELDLPAGAGVVAYSILFFGAALWATVEKGRKGA